MGGCKLPNLKTDNIPGCEKGRKDADDHAIDKFRATDFKPLDTWDIQGEVIEMIGKDSVSNFSVNGSPIDPKLTFVYLEVRMEILTGEQIGKLVDYCRDKMIDLHLKLGYHEYRTMFM